MASVLAAAEVAVVAVEVVVAVTVALVAVAAVLCFDMIFRHCWLWCSQKPYAKNH